PDGTKNDLNPRTPHSINDCNAPVFPGTTPPQNPVSTKHWPSAALNFSRNASVVVVAGIEFKGMSMIVVTPPAAAARVAVANPSQCVRPGSFTWTCVSARPGINTELSGTSTTLEPCVSS